MKNLKVKICGLTSKENILQVLELEPDFIGFIFHPSSPRFVEGRISAQEVANLPCKAMKTGVFVNAGFDSMTNAKRTFHLDALQLHGDESPALCRQLSETGLQVIKAFGIGEEFNFGLCEAYIPYCNYFLFDTGSPAWGGSGLKFNWNILDNYQLHHPFFLSGGISVEDADVIRKIRHQELAGVDLNSRFELAPGIKDAHLLKEFLNKIRRSE